MRMAGMPLRYLDSDRISEYIKACQDSNQVSSLVQSAMTLQRTEVWNNDRILELYKWHYSGQYDDIIEEYE